MGESSAPDPNVFEPPESVNNELDRTWIRFRIFPPTSKKISFKNINFNSFVTFLSFLSLKQFGRSGLIFSEPDPTFQLFRIRIRIGIRSSEEKIKIKQ